MNVKTIYLLALLLCIAAACKKDTHPDIPIPPPEPVTKYLAKVLLVGNDGTTYEKDRCTWDSLHRLKTYWSDRGYYFDSEFYYDSIGRVSQVDYNAPSLGGFCFVFDWENEKELNGIDIYMHNIFFDTTYYACRDTYLYDESGINVRIERFYANSNSTRIYQIEWDGLNITYAEGASRVFINNQKFDNKYSPWSVFPDIFVVGLVGDMNSELLYNPSKNNPIERADGRKYEYDYDEDGYPISQYYLQEDGTKELIYTFEYYE